MFMIMILEVPACTDIFRGLRSSCIAQWSDLVIAVQLVTFWVAQWVPNSCAQPITLQFSLSDFINVVLSPRHFSSDQDALIPKP